MFYIGIDLGTSAAKLLLVDERGAIARTVSRAYPVSYPRPGWSEQDPAAWWEAVASGVRELVAGIDATLIRAIGCGGQMHGLVALGAADEVVRPCILWNDGRTEEEVRFLNEEVGRARLRELTGNIAFAGFTAPKLLWMRAHEPEAFGRIAKIMLPKDYLTYRLTGEHVTDLSDASGTLLLDVAHRSWSAEMLELCHVRPGQMPRLLDATEPAGTLSAAAAAELGLPAGIVVAAGAGDNAAAAVGCGAVAAGSCNISLGTSGTVFVPTDRFTVDGRSALHSFAYVEGGFHLMGCILSAASCTGWFVGDILGTDDIDAEEAGVDPLRADVDLPYFLPYLMGERSPHNDTTARGAFVGLRADTSHPAMARAVREGVAFAIRDCVEVARAQGVAPARSTLCGGGARSSLMRRMLASVLDMELDLLETEQGPGFGAAMLAMVAAGDAPSVQACARTMVRVRATVRPDPTAVAAYDQRYQIWCGLYPALSPSFRAMAE